MTTDNAAEAKGGNTIRRLIIAGVIIALAVWFILANTEEVGVKLWLVKVETPMWIMITVVFIAGWAVGASTSLMHTLPARIRDANSCACDVSAVKIDAERPSGDCFAASAIASSIVSNGITAAIGAKDASRQTASSG